MSEAQSTFDTCHLCAGVLDGTTHRTLSWYRDADGFLLPIGEMGTRALAHDECIDLIPKRHHHRTEIASGVSALLTGQSVSVGNGVVHDLAPLSTWAPWDPPKKKDGWR